jgi:hypothetical protein
MHSLLKVHYEHILARGTCHVAVSFDTQDAASRHFDSHLISWVIQVETRLAKFQDLIFLVCLPKNCLHDLISRSGKYVQVWKFEKCLQCRRVHVYTVIMCLYYLQLSQFYIAANVTSRTDELVLS